MSALMPIHPITGLHAIGFTKRGPIWPVMGGSEDAPPVIADPAAPVDPAPVVGAPPEFAAIVLDSQDAVDKMFKDRIAQANRVAEKKAKDDRKALEDKLKAFEDAALTDTEKKDNALKAAEQLAAERGEALTKLERKVLVRDLAQDSGLPKKLWDRVSGETEDEIAADIKELVEALPPVADPGKGKPPVQAPTVRVSPPGDSSDPELSSDALLASINRNGNPSMDSLD